MRATTTLIALALATSACARKQEQAAAPAPIPASDSSSDDELFEDEGNFEDVFADDPSLGGDNSFSDPYGDPFAGGDPVGASGLDVQPGEATPATAGGGGNQSGLMLAQSLPAMMQAMQTGNPSAMIGMMTQMMGAQGGTGGQIMQLAAPLIQQAAAQGMQAAKQGGGARGQQCFGGASCQ